MQLKPMTPHMGAEVLNLDLNQLSQSDVSAVKAAFLQYMVLVFRDQELSEGGHKTFAGHFGELHIHPSKAQLDTRSDPEIFTVRTTPNSQWANGEVWHTDVSCEAIPPLGSVLHVQQLPGESGGDTLFANMYLAFESLSEKMKAWLRTLSAVHDGRKDLARYNIKLKANQTYPQAQHPVVIKHPETGKELLFVNRSFTEKIVGLTRKESDTVLEMLWHHVESAPRFQCRVRWAPGTVVLWDNRCTWHHAVWDYFPSTRHAQRVSIQGTTAPSWSA